MDKAHTSITIHHTATGMYTGVYFTAWTQSPHLTTSGIRN